MGLVALEPRPSGVRVWTSWTLKKGAKNPLPREGGYKVTLDEEGGDFKQVFLSSTITKKVSKVIII